MAEYIERKAAYALAKKICDAIRNREYHPATFGHLILDWIDDLPAADVAPVRHGFDTFEARYFKCSECGYGVADVFEAGPVFCFEGTKVGEQGWHYCPNCGAKLDGGTNIVVVDDP